MTLHAGRFRERVQIQQRTKTLVADGVDETWSIVEERWASLTPMNMSTRVRYQQIDTQATHRLQFRSPVLLPPLADVRFYWNGDLFSPFAPEMDAQARHRIQEMMVFRSSPEEKNDLVS